jgi:hypothetical protein
MREHHPVFRIRYAEPHRRFVFQKMRAVELIDRFRNKTEYESVAADREFASHRAIRPGLRSVAATDHFREADSIQSCRTNLTD